MSKNLLIAILSISFRWRIDSFQKTIINSKTGCQFSKHQEKASVSLIRYINAPLFLGL